MLIKRVGDREKLVEKKIRSGYLVTGNEFLRTILKDEERQAIYSAAKKDGIVESFLDFVRMEKEVDLRKIAEMEDGLPYLVSQGILTKDRVKEILER